MALYLGTNKIAGNITSIIQEGEAEIPEISEQNLFLADLDDGIYKCHYMFWWASQEEKEASMPTGLLTDYSDCILIKYTLPTTEIVLGQVCYPFSVRMIHTDYDIVINVGNDGMRETTYSMSISEFNTLQNDAKSMSSKITTLEETVNALPSQEITFIMSGNTDVTYTALRGMTWREWIGSEYNTDGYYITSTGNYISSANGNFTFTYVNDAQVFPWEVISSGETYYGAK